MKNTIFLSQLLVFPFKSLLSSREVWLCTSLFYYYKEAKDDVFSSISSPPPLIKPATVVIYSFEFPLAIHAAVQRPSA